MPGAPRRNSSRGSITPRSAGSLTPSPTISQSLESFTSFVQEPDLLRASTLDAVASRFGVIFRDSTGSEETYQMSQPVDYIDWFISHNWSTPRTFKFGVLCLRFNLVPALLIVSFLCIAVIVPGQVLGVIPYHVAPSLITGQVRPHFGGCLLFGSIVFPVTLLWWRDLLCWTYNKKGFYIGRHTRVFLDKVCIHQTDCHVKRRGIERLAGFIQNSRNMLIVFADTYLAKLWTVYEIASYLTLCPEGHLVIMPTFLPPTFLLCFALCTVVQIQSTAIHHFYGGKDFSSVYPIVGACHCLASIPVSILLRRWSKRKEAISRQVTDFSLRDAKCFDETDRALVQHNVAEMMRANGLVNEDASEDDALEAFDELVRREVPQFMYRSFAHSGIQYRYVTTMNISFLLRFFDSLASKLKRGAPTLVIAATSVGYLSIILCWWPLSVEVSNILVNYNLHARWFLEIFIVAIASIAGGSVYYVGIELTASVDSWARESAVMMALEICIVALLGLLTWCGYGDRFHDRASQATLSKSAIELSALPGALRSSAELRARSAVDEHIALTS